MANQRRSCWRLSCNSRLAARVSPPFGAPCRLLDARRARVHGRRPRLHAFHRITLHTSTQIPLLLLRSRTQQLPTLAQQHSRPLSPASTRSRTISCPAPDYCSLHHRIHTNLTSNSICALVPVTFNLHGILFHRVSSLLHVSQYSSAKRHRCPQSPTHTAHSALQPVAEKQLFSINIAAYHC